MLSTGLKILIFGVTGFIGQPLRHTLVRHGAHVVGVSRRRPSDDDAQGDGWHWVQADASDPTAVDRLFISQKPDVVYQLTSNGYGGQELDLVLPTLKNDLLPGMNVLVAAARHGVGHLVMAASLEEPFDTDVAQITPTTPYALSKMAVSSAARMTRRLYGVPLTLLRPMMTYGPGQKPFKVVPSIVRSLAHGDSAIIHSPDRPIDWVYIDDVVDAFVKVAPRPPAAGDACHTIDLGSGVMTTVMEVARLIAGIMGVSEANVAPTDSPSRKGEIVRRADVDETFRLIGWRSTTSLADGLERTIESVRNEATVASAADL